jgi:DNA repair ATPase RecN
MEPILLGVNSLGVVGVAVFLHYLFKGLQTRIAALTTLAEEQKKTLETVRVRAAELDRLSDSYKKAVADFEEMGQKLEMRRNALVKELEEPNQRQGR